MPNETVILLHGFLGNRLWMRYLESRLRADGYETLVWGYPSLRTPIEAHGERLARRLEGLVRDDAKRTEGPRTYHVVAHSMGSLIARDALARVDVPIRRMTMLAPPNRGSFAADRLAPWLGSIFVPLHQMRTCEESFVRGLGYPERTEIGVVAASRDFVVGDDSSIAPAMVDRIVLPSTHSGLLFYPETARQVRSFLRTGRFDRSRAGDAERRIAA